MVKPRGDGADEGITKERAGLTEERVRPCAELLADLFRLIRADQEKHEGEIRELHDLRTQVARLEAQRFVGGGEWWTL